RQDISDLGEHRAGFLAGLFDCGVLATHLPPELIDLAEALSEGRLQLDSSTLNGWLDGENLVHFAPPATSIARAGRFLAGPGSRSIGEGRPRAEGRGENQLAERSEMSELEHGDRRIRLPRL
ncbi:MAG: hypothetical protein GY856_17470, partial [bacterium]|nr:hypothetical protein [bacterium]